MKKYIIITLMIAILILSACSDDSECSKNSDCLQSNCKTMACIKGTCQTSFIKTDCCGNGKCEEPENQCSCPTDCGECEGKVQFKNQWDTLVDANYHEKGCTDDDSACVYSIDQDLKKQEIKEYKLTSSYFELVMTIKYNNPFEVNTFNEMDSDKFTLKLDLKKTESAFKGPLKITGVKFVEGNNIFGEKPFNIRLNKGDFIEKEIPFTAQLPSIEHQTRLDIKIDYEHERELSNGDIQSVQEVGRKVTMGDQIIFVETGSEVKDE